VRRLLALHRWPLMKRLMTPFSRISFVTDHIAIGGVAAYGEPLGEFGFLMNVAWEMVLGYEESKIDQHVVQHARLDDNFDVEAQLPEILRAVALLTAARGRGETVLVTCAAGRNRSALVVAEHLIQAGHDAAQVIAAIRTRRADALGNTAFVEWLQRKR
jgi:hypothetical protein